jgi:hypothetical protein
MNIDAWFTGDDGPSRDETTTTPTLMTSLIGPSSPLIAQAGPGQMLVVSLMADGKRRVVMCHEFRVESVRLQQPIE